MLTKPKPTFTLAPKIVLAELIASLTLADHLGDVASAVQRALELSGEPELAQMGFPEELSAALYKAGVKTLWNTSLEP